MNNRIHLVRRAGLGLALLGSTGAAFAHPGHGFDATQLLHWLTEPDHLLAMLLGASLSGIVAFIAGRVSRRGGA